MKGKILFTSKNDADCINLDEYDIKLQIVRYINKGLKKDFIHVEQLSPSEELFSRTMYKWKKLIFTQKEKDYMFNKGLTHSWWDLYEYKFNKEIDEEVAFIKAYNRLKEHLDNGKSIIAICYCEDFRRCHRRLIAERLIKEGYEVILR